MNPAVEDATGYTRPRDPIEVWLARQWHEVLGFTVGINESFFEIGGNSLDAARVINAVLEEFGVQLPLNVLTEAPTVERLAALLRDQNERLADPLVAIQHGDGTSPPLFLVHPASGQVGAYCRLADALGDEFTVFGLQATGLYSAADPIGTVDGMARAYLDAVQEIQPTGPYLLGGCSTGVAIAYAMATQLTSTDVGLLAAIDEELVEPGLADWQPDEALDDRSVRVWQANRDAARDWRPRPYPGLLDIFRDPAGNRPQIVDWPDTVARRVHECAPGTRQLADALRELIR